MHRNLILIRDSPEPSHAPAAEGFEIHLVANTQADVFSALDQLCSHNAFPPGWAATMLTSGAEAVLVTQSATPIAAGWLTRQRFDISEIRRSFDPGPQGDYYFGDFVAPSFRGRGLQRLLIHHRLLLTQDAGRHAIAMTRDDNPASLKSYSRAGFVTAAEILSRSFWRWQIDRIRYLTPNRAFCNVSQEGYRIPLFGLVRKR